MGTYLRAVRAHNPESSLLNDQGESVLIMEALLNLTRDGRDSIIVLLVRSFERRKKLG